MLEANLRHKQWYGQASADDLPVLGGAGWAEGAASGADAPGDPFVIFQAF